VRFKRSNNSRVCPASLEAFVEGLDLHQAGFIRVEPKAMGRPGYDPTDLLKLYIYGYLNRVRSSRRLEAEAHRNMEVICLLRHLKPDFRTIADFRRVNRAAFPAGVPGICPALPSTRPVRAGAAGRGWDADQGGEQQGPQLHARGFDEVHPRGR
jgi:hypothetical protein